MRQLTVQRLSIAEAAAQEFWPRRHRRLGIGFFGKQSPERGMVPAQLVTRTIAVLTDACAESLDLSDQVIARETLEIFIHGTLSTSA